MLRLTSRSSGSAKSLFVFAQWRSNVHRRQQQFIGGRTIGEAEVVAPSRSSHASTTITERQRHHKSSPLAIVSSSWRRPTSIIGQRVGRKNPSNYVSRAALSSGATTNIDDGTKKDCNGGVDDNVLAIDDTSDATVAAGTIANNDFGDYSESICLAISPEATTIVGGMAQQQDNVVISQLSWYNPAAQVMNLVHTIHDLTGFSYALSIASVTIFLRLCILLPLSIRSLDNSTRYDAMLPHITKLANIQKASSSSTRQAKIMYQQHVRALIIKYGYNPHHYYTRFLYPIINMSTFLSMWYGLRWMGHYYPQELTNSTLFWCPDLTKPDPIHFLPILSSTTFFIMGELGADSLGRPSKEMKWKSKWAWRAFRLWLLPILFNVPTAVFCYWIPNSLCSIGQTIALSHPSVLKSLGILHLPKVHNDEEEEKKGPVPMIRERIVRWWKRDGCSNKDRDKTHITFYEDVSEPSLDTKKEDIVENGEIGKTNEKVATPWPKKKPSKPSMMRRKKKKR